MWQLVEQFMYLIVASPCMNNEKSKNEIKRQEKPEMTNYERNCICK